MPRWTRGTTDPVPEQLKPGSTIAGYRLERVIGRGGMGIVYAAHDDHLGRSVALKLIAPEFTADGSLRERFLAESRIAASLDHPNVVPVYEAGEADGALFLAMQLVEGRDLRAALLEQGAMPPERAIPVIVQIASALEAAHTQGLVHRDVKPSNILLTAGAHGDHAYLSDFGLCKAVDSKVEISDTGQPIGTAEYMAPEQIRGEHADPRSDIYSLGCVALQCLTGTPPFAGDDLAVMVGHLEQSPRQLHGNATLNAVLQRAMAKNRADRWPTARAFAEGLESARASTTPTVVTSPARRRPSRSRAAGLSAAVLVIAALIGLVAAIKSHGSHKPQRSPAITLTSAGAIAAGDRRTVLAGGRLGVYLIRRVGDGGSINQVDEEQGRLMPATHLGSIPVGMAPVGDGRGWIVAVSSTRARSATLLRLASGHVTPTRTLPGQPGCVDYVLICNPAIGGGSIWVPIGSKIYRIDRSGTKGPDPFRLRAPIGEVIYERGALWAIEPRRLVRIDASTGEVAEKPLSGSLGPCLRPAQLTLSGSQLWILCIGSDPSRDELARVPINSPELAVAEMIRYPWASTVTGTETSLWATTSGRSPDITPLDPRTGRPVGASLPLPAAATWTVAVPPDLWVITFNGDSRKRMLVHLRSTSQS